MKKIIKTWIIVVLIAIVIVITVSLIFFRTPQRKRTEKQAENTDLLIEDISLSKGQICQVEYGDIVVLHYIAKIQGEESIIASTREEDRPFIFTVGDGNVPQGWEIGVEGMRVGDKRKITTPAHLAYGSGGIDNLVPPNAVVIFELEILEIR